jgi:serine protease Do
MMKEFENDMTIQNQDEFNGNGTAGEQGEDRIPESAGTEFLPETEPAVPAPSDASDTADADDAADADEAAPADEKTAAEEEHELFAREYTENPVTEEAPGSSPETAVRTPEAASDGNGPDAYSDRQTVPQYAQPTGYAQAPQYAQSTGYAQAPQYVQSTGYAQAPRYEQTARYAQPAPNAEPLQYAQTPQDRQDRTVYSPYPQNAPYIPRGTSARNGASAANSYQGPVYNAYAASAPSADQTGAISYAPAKKEKKEKKPLGTRAVALICAVCVLLSGLCGFGGTLLANRISGVSGKTQTASGQSHASGSGDSVVIYKNVDPVVTSTSSSTGSDLSYAEVAAIVKDSVVEINTEYTTRNSWFQYTTGGAGSGVVISEDGYIITNAHVILDEEMANVADTVTVRLTDGSEFPADVKVYDSEEDIAIIKIKASGLTPAHCGDSDKLAVGEELVIVGNPLGELGGSVSNGIVSATEREIQVGGVSMHLIQTNAAVNPGNSGGGMFNMKGELVGIVNAKSSGTGIEGLGFAIPINQVLGVTEQLLEYGYVRGKPMIGVSFTDVSGSNYFFYYNVKAGVYVSGLVAGMNDNVLKEGDRIIAVNGEEISSSDDIKALVYASSVGDKMTFQLYREGKLMEVEVTCYERTPETKDASISFDSDVQGSLDDFFGGR